MPDRFLSSEEYDEQAHKLYNDGDYDGALEMLKEGLSLYPNAVELYVGLGYARLAREEYAWARKSFEQAVVLDGAHEDALVGLGETLLRFGEQEHALRLFDEVAAMGYDDDIELMLTMGRALYREALYAQCRDVFAKAAAARPDSADAAASLGYALHRLGDDVGAGRQIRRALRLDADLHEARVYLGHLLYDRGDWEGALRELERVPPQEHWDALAVWRLMELKRALWQLDGGDSRLAPWEQRLRELEAQQKDGTFEQLTKKEALMRSREMDKLERSIGGIKEMGGLPDAMFVIDVDHERIAVQEANKLGIPVIGIVDTNSNPDGIDYVIPGNDDAIRAIQIYVSAAADAILEGKQGGASADEFVEVAEEAPAAE